MIICGRIALTIKRIGDALRKKITKTIASSKNITTFATAIKKAQVAELVDAHVSGACAARREGSSPFLGTTSC